MSCRSRCRIDSLPLRLPFTLFTFALAARSAPFASSHRKRRHVDGAVGVGTPCLCISDCLEGEGDLRRRLSGNYRVQAV
ncbi:hypothetical protein FB451DRAFT_1255523 [Mycena latifolia]|nr:hypothetical protein FB451DRAFT_1255523 [Mycena latifolia]